MKGLIFGLIIAVAGFSLMAFSYFKYQYDPGTSPWKDAFMYIGKGQPPSEPGGFEYVTRPMRMLPISARAENFVPLTRSFGPQVEKSYRFSFQEKVVLYTSLSADFSEKELAWGRLPSPDADEVVAGFYAGHKDNIVLNGRSFKVVGQFSESIRLFADSYLICNNSVAGELFDPNDPAVQQAHILRLPPEQ